MRVFRLLMMMILVCGACGLLASCSKKNDKDGAASSSSQTQTGGPAYGQNQHSAASGTSSGKTAPLVVAAANNIGEALASIPCKLEDQFGAFAVFPNNPVPGQQCFELALDAGKEIPPFDIKSKELTFIIHERTAIILMKWADRNGKPCLKRGCGVEITASRKTFNDPKNPGGVFVIITPQSPVDLSSATGSYFGLVMKSGGGDSSYIPVFK